MKGGPFALSLHWPDLALVVSGVSLKSGPISVSLMKKGHCKSRVFFPNWKQQKTHLSQPETFLKRNRKIRKKIRNSKLCDLRAETRKRGNKALALSHNTCLSQV